MWGNYSRGILFKEIRYILKIQKNTIKSNFETENTNFYNLYKFSITHVSLHYFSEPPPNIPQSDEKILVECDTANDCPLSELSNCNIMLTPTSSGKRGYCVPSLCQSDGNCPKLGDECTSGSLTGTCNPRNTCEYNQLLAIATCGKAI